MDVLAEKEQEFLDEVAHNLGLGFKPATDLRGAGGAAAPDPEMATPWRRALDADARDEAWWSDESDKRRRKGAPPAGATLDRERRKQSW